MMKKTLSLLAVLFAVQPIASQADITVLGGLNMSNPTFYNVATGNTLTVNSSSNAAFSFGALIDTSMIPGFNLEGGVLLYNESINLTSTSGYKTTKLHLPAMFRVTALPFISAGAGFYLDLGMGDVSIFNGTGTTSISYDLANLNKTDYGLDFDLRVQFPIVPGIDAVLDGRYQFGFAQLLSDSATTNIGAHTRAIQVLGGVSIGL